MVSAHYLKTIYHRAFKFNRLSSLGNDITCIDFGFTRSNVNVTGVVLVKQWFPLIILRNIYHKAIIFHMLIGFGEAMTPFDFGLTRLKVQVTRFTC